MLPFSIITDNTDTLDVSVCMSERTRQIVLAALAGIQERLDWDEMTDADWDTTDASISDAFNELLSTDAC